jgi:hypothetical protein
MKKNSPKVKEATDVTQRAFDFIDTMPDVAPKVRHRVMYYITRTHDAEMLTGFDEHGFPLWEEHDLMRYQPHVINCVRRAWEYANKLGGQPRSCIKDDVARRYLPISVKVPVQKPSKGV